MQLSNNIHCNVKRDKVTPPFNCRCLIDYTQTCQPLIKENLETHKKKSGDSTKSIEILFFFTLSILINEHFSQWGGGGGVKYLFKYCAYHAYSNGFYFLEMKDRNISSA